MLKYKMKIDCVTSGQAAIDKIRAGTPAYNAIFMDHMMPEMDGVEAAHAIRALDTEYARGVPIIALTANAVLGAEKMFLENGFQDFLSKPIDIIQLDAVLRKWVRDHMPEGTADVPDVFALAALSPEEAGPAIDIPGVNAKDAIARFGNDASIYLSILRSYMSGVPAILDRLRDAGPETLRSCAISAHGLKGSSANIGAEAVAEAAAELEAVARKGDLARFTALAEPLLKDTERLAADISAWLKAYDAAHRKPSLQAPDRDVLIQLRRSCEAYDMSGIDEAMDELESVSYDTGADLVEWLREKIGVMEMDEVVERLKRYEIEGG
jgi:CheY-like chemotaxis protein